MARPKSKRNLIRLNLTIDKDVLEEARLTIDSISLYVESCLRKHNESEKKRREGQLRIIDIKSSNVDYDDPLSILSEDDANYYVKEHLDSLCEDNYQHTTRFLEIQARVENFEKEIEKKKSHQYRWRKGHFHFNSL